MSDVYKVEIAPLTADDTYGSYVDVSDRVPEAGIGKIKKGLDATDYDFGVFIFGDITLNCFNEDGFFNDEQDARSLFQFKRDMAKVRVTFENIVLDSNGDAAFTDTIQFNGLINEEATRLNLAKETIKLKVLSEDSVLRTTKVGAGAVTSGVTFKAALETILNVPRITSILNFSAANINPATNLTIDDGSDFDNNTVKAALNKLMIASNSIFYIDSSNNMIVKDRKETETNPIVNLFGPYDELGRENIIKILAYNTGKHRMFNQIRVNDQTRGNAALQTTFGIRTKTVTFPFMTAALKEIQIADALVSEFSAPKIELKVTVSTTLAKTIDILDRVSISYPYRILAPDDGNFLPVVGTAKIGDALTPLPRFTGSVAIDTNTAFKVIEISHNPKSFESVLHLRQVGTTLSDGVFATEGNCIVGFAVIGECAIAAGDTDTANPSVVGAAVIGGTKVS